MKNLSNIDENKDMVTKEYVDEAVLSSGGGITLADVEETINSDLSKPLNEQLVNSNKKHFTPSESVQNVIVSTETISNPHNKSIIVGSWTASYDGDINVQYTIKAQNGYGAFWCSTISTSTERETAAASADTPLFNGFIGAVGSPTLLPTTYTTYTTKMRVQAGETYYFHLSGLSSSSRGYINSLQLLYGTANRFIPYLAFNNQNSLELQPNVTNVAYISSTSAQTYLGVGQLTVANLSTAQLTAVVYPNAKGAGITLTLPANGIIFLPFNGTIKVQTPNSSVRVAVVYYD